VIFIDTSVIVAASSLVHASRDSCLDRLVWARDHGGACASHSLAEVFSALTSMPPPYRIKPADALVIVKGIGDAFQIVALTPTEYLATIQSAAARGLTGGIIYDALLLACARKVKATHIYTLNVRHFRAAAPDLADRIHIP
jgi:predicted nucleic acid-binding protein